MVATVKTIQRVIEIAVIISTFAVAGQTQDKERHWYKGNTHTHTTNSDGGSAPVDVARWYRQHGYDFLFITDHDMVTDVTPLNTLISADGKFLAMRGEEVTSEFTVPELHVHVNALNPSVTVAALRGLNRRETLQADVHAIQAAHAIAQINHPNFFWHLTAEDIAAIKGAGLLEIANMHPIVNGFGAGPNFPSAEEIWDGVLSRGVSIWGVASDDMHELNESAKGSSDYGRGALPGRGWIVVHAKSLTADELQKAIELGEFYASTGVELRDYVTGPKQITVSVKPLSNGRFQTRYRVQFIGKNGRLLEEAEGDSVVYRIKGDEMYIRARIIDSNGKMAWTQPYFVH